MDLSVFLLCLKKGKLFDAGDHPLRLYLDDFSDDTFFRCFALGIGADTRAHVTLRARSLLFFIDLMFEGGGAVESIDEFLALPADQIRLKSKCYRHQAIQTWGRRFGPPLGCSTAKTFLKLKPTEMKRVAVEFVRAHNYLDVMKCHLTFGFLLASLLNVVVHFYEETPAAVHIQPEIRPIVQHAHQAPRDEQLASNTVHIYMWKSLSRCYLLVPRFQSELSRLQRVIMENNGESRQKALYQLRRTDKKRKNIALCLLQRTSDSRLHVCDITDKMLTHRATYQIYPAPGPDFLFRLKDDEHLYIFAIIEATTDIVPHAECIFQQNHGMTYPYFALQEDTKQLVVVVTNESALAAKKIIQQTLAVD